MRISALLLSLLLVITPWSGAFSQWQIENKQSAAQTPADQIAAMPCHSQPDSDNTGTACDGCGDDACSMDGCQCGGTTTGVTGMFVMHQIPTQCEQHSRKLHPPASFESIPDSPPPIA